MAILQNQLHCPTILGARRTARIEPANFSKCPHFASVNDKRKGPCAGSYRSLSKINDFSRRVEGGGVPFPGHAGRRQQQATSSIFV